MPLHDRQQKQRQAAAAGVQAGRAERTGGGVGAARALRALRGKRLVGAVVVVDAAGYRV